MNKMNAKKLHNYTSDVK